MLAEDLLHDGAVALGVRVDRGHLALDELVVLGRGLPVELEVASGNLLPNGHKLAVGDLELRRYFIYLLPP